MKKWPCSIFCKAIFGANEKNKSPAMQGTVQIALALSIEKTSHAIMMKFYDCIKIGGGFVLCVNH